MLELRSTARGRRRRLVQIVVRLAAGGVTLLLAVLLLRDLLSSPQPPAGWALVLIAAGATVAAYRLVPGILGLAVVASPVVYAVAGRDLTGDARTWLTCVVAGASGAFALILIIWVLRQATWLPRRARGELYLIATPAQLTVGWERPYGWSELADVLVERFSDPLGWTWQLRYRVAGERRRRFIDLVLFGEEPHGEDVRERLRRFVPEPPAGGP